jgi:nucleotide-binding universal stress UspA family protein
MFHHILVPTDLSGHTARAADMARDMGRAAGARIMLFHVIETLSGANFDEFGSFYRELEGRASSHLTALALRFEASGLEVAKTVIYGKPAEEIVRFAVDKSGRSHRVGVHKVDLSRPGHGWGTLSDKVGVLAPCPVLLVK